MIMFLICFLIMNIFISIVKQNIYTFLILIDIWKFSIDKKPYPKSNKQYCSINFHHVSKIINTELVLELERGWSVIFEAWTCQEQEDEGATISYNHNWWTVFYNFLIFILVPYCQVNRIWLAIYGVKHFWIFLYQFIVKTCRIHYQIYFEVS